MAKENKTRDMLVREAEELAKRISSGNDRPGGYSIVLNAMGTLTYNYSDKDILEMKLELLNDNSRWVLR